MPRVLFAHGHLLRFDPKQFAIGKPYPPLATLFAAAYARSLGHEVALFDPMLDQDTSGLARALQRHEPDVLVLYDDSFNWFTKMCLSRMREAANEMIKLAHARGIMVIVAGHDAADEPDAYLKNGASFVIRGEGERTLGELLSAFANANGDADRLRESALLIDGLAFRHRGMVRKTSSRRLLSDLDVLPLPAWDLVDIERYRTFWRKKHGYFSLNVVTTRGCPYLCNWCAKPTYGNTYHSRSPANVIAELKLLRETYAPDHIWFCDDILGLKAKWLMAFAEGVSAANVRTPFLCQTRADLMTEDNVRGLAEAGAQEVWLGAESGSQRILDAMQKGITVEQTRAATTRLRARGVRVGLFLQFGYSGEDWSDVAATRALVRELVPDDIGISVSYPLPGTGYYKAVSSQLGEKRNWNDSRDLDPMIPKAFSARFYQTLSRAMHAELRMLRGKEALRAIVRSPRSLNKLTMRRIAGLRHLGRWLLSRVQLEAEGKWRRS